MIDISLLCDTKISKFPIIVVNGVRMSCEIDLKNLNVSVDVQPVTWILSFV